MDSSDNNELFADSDENPEDKEQMERENANCPPPEYIDHFAFKEF